VKIAGKKFWLWRAADPHGVVLEDILQARLNKREAKRLLSRLLNRHGSMPKRIVTDKLRSYGAAKREVAPGLDHWSHKGLNNRAENSHLPFRKRERTMQDFRSLGDCSVSIQFIPQPAIASRSLSSDAPP
jgi:putative transposase